jgi:hypothetical protein
MTTPDPICDENGVVLEPDAGPHRKPFAAFVQSHEYGQTHEELTRGLHELLSAVQHIGRAGSLTLTVKASPVGRGDGRQVTIAVSVKSKLPEMGAVDAIYWIDDQGNLWRSGTGQVAA